MDTALDLPTVTVMPLPEAVKFAVIVGVVIGLPMALFEIFTGVIKYKLHLTQSDHWSSLLVVQFCTSMLVILMGYLAIQWVFPSKVMRMLLLDQALETLGYFPFFLISFIIVIPFSALGRRMQKWILNQ